MTTPLRRIAIPFRERLRALWGRDPVTSIPDWDMRVPMPQPLPDVDAAEARVIMMIDELADAGSLDEAHGAVLDRLIMSWCDQWRESAKRHHLQQDSVLTALRNQGVQHLVILGRVLESHRVERDRHLRFIDARWDRLTLQEREHLAANPQAGVKPAVLSLAVIDEHPLLTLPMPSAAEQVAPFEPLPPPTALTEYRRNNHSHDQRHSEGAS